MLKTILMLHLAVFLSGWTGVFGKLIDYDAFVLVTIRMTFTAILIFSYVLITKKLQHFAPKVIMQNLTAGALLSCHLVFFYLAIKCSNVAIGTITLSSAPFWSAIIEPLIIKESKFKLINLVYSFIVMIGIFLIFSLDPKFQLGILLGLVSAFSAAIFAIANKKATSGRDPYTCLNYEMMGSSLITILLVPLYIYNYGTSGFYFDVKDAIYMFILCTFCTGFLYLLLIFVIRHVSAFTVTLSMNLEPVWAILFAILLFDEHKDLNYSFYIGIVLIVISVILQNKQQKKID